VNEAAILDFVSKRFQSVWPIELLLVMSQEANQGWQVATLARELRASVAAVSQGLVALQAIGFVAADTERTYRFKPASDALAELARELIELYGRKPRTVIRAIFAPPNDRIQTFADAFRLRKDTC
jgi:hypothetical protein